MCWRVDVSTYLINCSHAQVYYLESLKSTNHNKSYMPILTKIISFNSKTILSKVRFKAAENTTNIKQYKTQQNIT